MTNEELLALKVLAQKAKPFTADECHDREDTAEEVARSRVNAGFFLAIHSVAPVLIDELLELRQKCQPVP